MNNIIQSLFGPLDATYCNYFYYLSIFFFAIFLFSSLNLLKKLFDGKKLEFNFHHLTSSNVTFIDKDLEEKTKTFDGFKSYNYFFKSNSISFPPSRQNGLFKIAAESRSIAF